jgi:predicted transcriptional regulator
MNEITIGVANRDTVSNRFIEAFETGKPLGNTISFESERQLWMTLTLERWEILKVLAGAGFVSANLVARRVNRDERSVLDDMEILLNTGFLEKSEDGKFAFPYDTVHVDFVLKAA